MAYLPRLPPGISSRFGREEREARGSQIGRHLEQLALLRPFDAAPAGALCADAFRRDGTFGFHLDALQVGPEGALGRAGDLAADAAEVLGLAAVGLLIAHRWFLATNGTLLSHDSPHCRSGPGGRAV